MSSVQRNLKRPGQTADQIFQRLIEAILSGAFPSGAVVRESRLARQWRIGRTPLREAMRRAAETGFIVLRPNQAPIVRLLTIKDMRDLYDLRLVLEKHALELAWPHITKEDIESVRALAAQAKPSDHRDWPKRCLKLDLALHGLWIHRCGNSWLGATLEMQYRFLRIFQRWIGQNPAFLARSYAEHLVALDALERRDKAGALAWLRQHIEASAKLVEEVMSTHTPSAQ